MSDIYWVGPRQSDIENTNRIFKGSITIYGDNTDGNIAFCQNGTRINHNVENKMCNDFIKNQLLSILKNNPSSKVMFYNQEHAFQYGEYIEKHSIGKNDKNLLKNLSNKAKSRFLLSNIVNVIPYITLKGIDCTYNNLCSFFSDSEFIVQKIFSSGGDSTYHIKQENSFVTDSICEDKNGDYILSPFLSDTISLNIHIIIEEKQIHLLPASIQVICEQDTKLLYSGADFICFHELPEHIKEMLNTDAYKIGFILQKKGYRGILGIDFVLHEGKLYFMELNPRFQASSDLINKAFSDNAQKSLQELHLLAFEDGIGGIKTDIEVNYSNFSYTTNNISNYRLEKVIASNEISYRQLDGYYSNADKYNDNNAYLFRCVFEKNICTIKDGKILLHPNIYTEDIKPYIVSNKEYHKESTKFALLNHGVTLSEKANSFIKEQGEIRNAVFDAIDITIFDSINVNVPYSCKFNSISPFTIDMYEGKLVLLFDNNIITTVKIDLTPSNLINKKTSSGIPYTAIIHLATDRIRINPAPVCIYKENGTSCKFCNLPEKNYRYGLNDIKEVIDYCLANVDFRHFLIGGGTYSLNGGWEIILEITKYIRSRCKKDIYLMSIPPKDSFILDSLKMAGITEVAFNLEMFDRTLACQIMPGKGKIPMQQYTEVFQHAVTLWGNLGHVRSLLIYGFDTEKDFLNGLEDLCRIGVEPIISIFRPLSGTLLENTNPPATLELFDLYIKCKDIAQKYSIHLGPDCPACQNNTLSFPE